MTERPSLRVLVGRVVDEKGYAFSYPASEDEARSFGLTIKTSVTFSCNLLPRGQKLIAGQVVYLSELIETGKGWRALSASLAAASAGDKNVEKHA